MRFNVYTGLMLLGAVRDAVSQPSCEAEPLYTTLGCPGQTVNATYDNCTVWCAEYMNNYYRCLNDNDNTCIWGSTPCFPGAPSPGPAPGAYPAPSSPPVCSGTQINDNCDAPYWGCEGYALADDGNYYGCDLSVRTCVTGLPCDPQTCANEAPDGDCTNVKPVDPRQPPEETCYQYYQPNGKGGYVQCMGVAAGHTPCKASTVSCPGPASSNSSMFVNPDKKTSLVGASSLRMG